MRTVLKKASCTPYENDSQVGRLTIPRTEILVNTSEYTEAKATLRVASHAYYTTGTSPLSDADFDALNSAVIAFEAREGITADLVAGTVGAGAPLSGSVRHSIAMLSLDNVYSVDDLNAWWRSVGCAEMVAEPKLDGLAMSILYRDGRPVQMLTRGDGHTGEDMTAALPLIDNLPSPATTARGQLFHGEVRGEVLFSRTQFIDASTARVASGKPAFANARNAAAGTVNRAVRSGVDTVPARTKLSFVCYDAFTPVVPSRTHTQLMDGLSRLGFTVAYRLLSPALVAQAADMLAGDSTVPMGKPTLPFEIDGLVFKAASLDARHDLGETSRAPRWARAYKFPPNEAYTTLRQVVWETGRTGNVTPRAVLDPVQVGGTTITSATLNNPGDIARKGLALGDRVVVRRAAEVIPEVTGVAPGPSQATGPILIPTRCPNCGEQLDADGARLRCPSGGACALDRRLTYAVSRDALDIDGLSGALIEAAIGCGLLSGVADLFCVDAEQWAKVPTGRTTADGRPILVGTTTASKIAAATEEALHKATFARVLIALGLAGTGRSMSKRLASHFKSMGALLAADADTLAQVDGLGDVKAASLVRQLQLLAADGTVERLAAVGLPLTEVATDEPGSEKPLAGQVLVVTGSMSRLGSRSEVTGNLEAWGATVASSVSAKTTLVVAADPEGSSSKLVKARKLGVEIVDEAGFCARFGLGQ